MFWSLPTQWSDGESFSFVERKLPQREQCPFLVPKFIWSVFEITEVLCNVIVSVLVHHSFCNKQNSGFSSSTYRLKSKSEPSTRHQRNRPIILAARVTFEMSSVCDSRATSFFLVLSSSFRYAGTCLAFSFAFSWTEKSK